MDVERVAEALGVSAGTVKSTLHRARAALRRRLAAAAPHMEEVPGMTTWFMAGDHPEQYERGSLAEGGRRIARLTFRGGEPQGFGTLMQQFLADRYRGKRVRFAAGVRSRGAGWAALWMRVDDAEGRILAFDNMSDRPLQGTHDWTRAAVVLDVAPEASEICFGFLLSGTGEAQMTDLAFEEVGPDVAVTGRDDRAFEPRNLELREE
jgi:hypothetical protein